MTMPGFNAEGSLYAKSGRHHLARIRGASAATQGVAPQLPKSIGFCMADCDEQYEWGTLDNTACKTDCLDDGNGGDGGGSGGGGGGGGGGQHCTKCLTIGPHRGQRHCAIPGVGGYWEWC
jgi:hypothetical protein